MSAANELPRRYGDYLLITQIGKGGMAEVYRAERLGAAGFSREVAVKRMLARLGDSEHFNQRFLDEAKLVSGLAHRNIVQTLDLGRAEGTYFIAMELVRGRDLRELQKALHTAGEPMPVDVAVYVILEILRGLHYAHEHRQRDGAPLNLIHRDISPSNVLLSFEGDVKLCDFGIAKAANLGDVTRTGIVKGKVPYLAPEALHPDGGPVDRRVDVYAVGLVLFELLAGRRTFKGKDAPIIIDAILHRDLPDLRTFRPDASEEIENVYRRATTRDPTERFESAEAMRAELARVTQGSGASPESLAQILRRLFPDAVTGPQQYEPQFEARLAELRSAPPDTVPDEPEPDSSEAATVGLEGRALESSSMPAVPAPPIGREPVVTSRAVPWPVIGSVVVLLAGLGWAQWYRGGPASLEITSVPPGATVTLNGSGAGAAPVRLDEVEAAAWHEVRCSWAGIESAPVRLRCPVRATCQVACTKPPSAASP